jgi:hypothetical protein
MKDELLSELDGLRRRINIANVPMMWDEEIRILKKLKELGSITVFGGLDIDEQIKERQKMKRLFLKIQNGDFEQR